MKGDDECDQGAPGPGRAARRELLEAALSGVPAVAFEHAPDVLVLGAGGALAGVWMQGVLAGLTAETGIDFRSVEHLIGTSVGAVVAVELLAGRVVDGTPVGGAGAGDADAGDDSIDIEDDAALGGEHATGTAGGGANAGGADAGDDSVDIEDGAALGGRHAAETAGGGAGGDEPGGGETGGGKTGGGAGAWVVRAVRGPFGGVARVAAGAAKAAGGAAAGPLVPFALTASRPAGALLRAGVLTRIPSPGATLDELGARIARDGLRFDGRLRVVAVDRESGRRVVFGAPGAPPATVAEAVQASCSVPWLYRPVRIGDGEYVDGGLWSPTSLDAAPAGRATHVLCLNPTAHVIGETAAHAAVRVASRSAAALEAAALRRRGAIVTVIGPDQQAAAALAGAHTGPPDGDLAARARTAGVRQGRALARGNG